MLEYIRVWIKHNGSIPKDWEGKSYEIHHIDGDHENNVIENLRCVSIREHYDIHWFQGDWGACFLLAQKMKMKPEEISHLATLTQQKRIEMGTHNFLGPNNNKKKIENGTHHFLGSKVNKQRVANGNHNFLGGEQSKKNYQKMLLKNDGIHPFHQEYQCPHCGKIGKGMSNMFRWHFNNCKFKIKELFGEESLALRVI